ncbi:MAG: TetR/AcrR family transcriptional regulator [Hyphomonas sp.]
MEAPLLPESPAERRRLRVRTAILEAAERVFSVEGEAGLSIRRLADEIDYSPAAIYKYFGSKEELLDELKESFFERLMSTVDRASLASLPFEDRACQCFAKYVETAIARPHHYAAAFSSPGEPQEDEGGRKLWAEFEASNKGQAFLVVAGLIEEGQARGIFDPSFDPVVAAKSLWASMHGLALLLIHIPEFPGLLPVPGKSLDTADFVRFHSNLLYRSLCRPTSPPDPIGPNL